MDGVESEISCLYPKFTKTCWTRPQRYPVVSEKCLLEIGILATLGRSVAEGLKSSVTKYKQYQDDTGVCKFGGLFWGRVLEILSRRLQRNDWARKCCRKND